MSRFVHITLLSMLFCVPGAQRAAAQTSIVYKGLFAPGLMLTNLFAYSMDDPAVLRRDGFNYANITPVFITDSNGTVTQYTTDQEIIDKILEWHTNDLAVSLIPILFFSPDGDPANHSAFITNVIAARGVHTNGFLVEMTNLAALAEVHCVEVFSPLNEPEKSIGGALGIPAASSWAQLVLPLVRSNFTGKVLWKGLNHVVITNINTTGYDLIGVTITPNPSQQANIMLYTNFVADAVTNLLIAQSLYGVPEITLSELGPFLGGLWTNQLQPDAYEIAFAVGAGHLDGFFLFEGLDPLVEPPLQGTAAELVVSNWFNNIFDTGHGFSKNNNLAIFAGGDGDGADSVISTLGISQQAPHVGLTILIK